MNSTEEEGDPSVRHSAAKSAALVTEPLQKARLEASNSLAQAGRVRDVVLSALEGEMQFRLRPSLVLNLNRCAIEGLDAYAGLWRPAGVEIGGSKHEPPGAYLVPELMEDLCEFINDNWDNYTATRLSSIVLWRVNWIHPFTDGNGRTARALAHIVLSVRGGLYIPGKLTIPEQILGDRNAYYAALEQADADYKETNDLSRCVGDLEDLISRYLAVQLKNAFESATGEAI